MKKILLSIILLLFGIANSQVAIYQTTVAGASGAEITPTANGPATCMGDAIVLAGSERFLNSITGKFFNLTATTPFTMTMTVYTQCPTSSATAACGSLGTVIAGATSTVSVTPSATLGTTFDVVFPFSNIDLSSETDNSITVMINASRNDVYWILGETPTVGSVPAGETGFGFATRCGSVAANNGCARNFGIANNFSMTVFASATSLSANDFDKSNILVYPNPVNDFVNISNDNSFEIKKVEITDINGRTIKTIVLDIPSQELNIDVADLSSGIYFLVINTAEGNAVKKFIKS